MSKGHESGHARLPPVVTYNFNITINNGRNGTWCPEWHKKSKLYLSDVFRTKHASDFETFQFWNICINFTFWVFLKIWTPILFETRSVCLFLSFSPPNPYCIQGPWVPTDSPEPTSHLCRSTGMIAMHYWSASSHKVGSGDSNSGLQACMMSALPHWDISPWPFQSIFDFVFSN